MFHKHKWDEMERFYAPPSNLIGRLKNCEPLLFQQLQQGFTTIRFECTVCGKIKTEEILGKSLKE